MTKQEVIKKLKTLPDTWSVRPNLIRISLGNTDSIPDEIKSLLDAIGAERDSTDILAKKCPSPSFVTYDLSWCRYTLDIRDFE